MKPTRLSDLPFVEVFTTETFPLSELEEVVVNSPNATEEKSSELIHRHIPAASLNDQGEEFLVKGSLPILLPAYEILLAKRQVISAQVNMWVVHEII